MSDDYDSSSDSPPPRKQARSQSLKKSSGACVGCKSLKVRCEFTPGDKICQRCRAGNHECVPRTRKKRKPAPTHQDLLEKSYNQDCEIQKLLLQLDRLQADSKIRDWITRNSLDSKKENDRISWQYDNTRPEEAAMSHFALGDVSGSLTLPDIVKHCQLFPEDINTLFSLYFERINPFFSVLDPELHTPSKLIWANPFLFTVICATAARYYTARLDIYPLATDFAHDAAGKALIEGSKTVDVCQAFLILSVYPVPKKRWAEDRSWLLQGAAITLALELGLDQPPPQSCDEREALNRMRTWLNCFCVDHSHSIQFGKFRAIQNTYLARTSRDWYRSSPLNIPFDVHLVAYVQLIILMAEWRSIIGDDGQTLQQRHREGLDVVSESLLMASKLQQELDWWVVRYQQELAYNPLEICAYRGNTTQMITSYLRLVVLAVAFPYAVKNGVSRDSEILKQSIDAARSVIQIMSERLYPTGFLRYAMDANFMYVSFAAAYLVNLLRPRFLPLLDETTQDDIVNSVDRLIFVLNDIALNGRHTPALHARFLSSLLLKYHRKLSPDSSPSDSSDNLKIYPQYSKDRRHTPLSHWPDVASSSSASGAPRQLEFDLGNRTVYQEPGDADMDLSINNFVRSVGNQIPIHHSYVHHSTENAWNLGQATTVWGAHTPNWMSTFPGFQ